MIQEVTIDFNLDTLTVNATPLRLPVGVSYIISLNLVKDGRSNHRLSNDSNRTINLYFDDKNPVNINDSIHEINNLSWIWDDFSRTYKAGFNASTRPLNLVATPTFITRLSVVDLETAGVYTTTFHTLFRGVPLRPINSCISISGLPQAFLDFWDQNFNWLSLPDKPDLPQVFNPNQSGIWTEIGDISDALEIGFYRTPDGALYWNGNLDSGADLISSP